MVDITGICRDEADLTGRLFLVEERYAMGLTAEAITTDRPLVPRQVAERWGCSERHVRNLIASGELRHFRLGGRLLRIPASAVEEFEQRQMDGVRPMAASAGQRAEAATALARALTRKRTEP